MKNQSTSTEGALQGKAIGIAFLAFLFMLIIVTGCKKKAPVIDPAQIQREFVQNLTSYPAPDFTQALGKAYTNPGEYTITKLPKGSMLSYKKDMTTYRGTLETDLYCLRKTSGLYMSDGTVILSGPNGEDFSFNVLLFPQDTEWNRTQLFQFNEKYPLTILTKDFHAPIKDYEDLQNIWDPDEESRYVLGQPVPGYIIETTTNLYLYGKELQPWHTHEQVTAAMKK